MTDVVAQVVISLVVGFGVMQLVLRIDEWLRQV